MSRVDPELRAATVARLRGLRAAGELTSADVRRTAAGLGVDERSVWRWLAQDGDDRPVRRRYELTEGDVDAFYDWRGNVAAVHRARAAAGATGLPSLATLQRAFAEQLTPGERADAVDGTEGRRRHQVYLRWAPDRRNALWEADHKELPVLVMAPRAQQPRKPWVTLFIEAYSRLIMGWALSLHPNAAVVLAALRRGIVVDPARGPFGGLPEKLVPDNGLEFAAAALRRSSAALGIELAPTPKYQGYAKGKVERVNRTLDQEFLSGLPFHTHGARAADGHLFGPDVAPMGLELFCELFAEWVTRYNTERVHTELGASPLARWNTDATPLREVPTEQLRWMLMGDAERTIGKDGIHFDGLRFIAPELNGLVGERVQVRYTPHDRRQIEVFRGDAWLATAHPQDLLSDEQQAAVLERRRADAAEAGKRRRRASRRARATLAPITAPGEVVDTTTISAEQARRETEQTRGTARTGPRADEDLRREAMTTLLDLKTDFAYWNPDLNREVAMSEPGESREPPVLDDLPVRPATEGLDVAGDGPDRGGEGGACS